jgi:hypothetical protein
VHPTFFKSTLRLFIYFQALENKLNLNYSIVTEVSESNLTHPIIQTVSDDKVDIVADSFVPTQKRHKFVDFSYPLKE